jgi:hypothetical protein
MMHFVHRRALSVGAALLLGGRIALACTTGEGAASVNAASDAMVTSGTVTGDSGGATGADAGDAASFDGTAGYCVAMEAGAAPSLEAGGPCGTMSFPFASFSTGGGAGLSGKYDGGLLRPGIYDAIRMGRNTSQPVGDRWREVLVVDAEGNFTRTREGQTWSGVGGRFSYRAGRMKADGGVLTLTFTCAYSEDTVPGPVAEADAAAEDLFWNADCEALAYGGPGHPAMWVVEFKRR